MADIGIGIHRVIQDVDGEAATVTSNRLDVNATLVAGASIDIGDVEIKGHSAILHDRNTDVSSSTPEQLTTNDRPCKHVDIMAAIANTGIIYIGGAGVAVTTGIALYAGDVYSLDIENVNLLYGIASVDTEDVQWVYYV